MDWLNLIINLVSGGVGGNIAGSMKDTSLGALGNTIAGAIGGAAGTWILQATNVLSSMGMADMTVGSLLGSVGASVVSGGVITAIIGVIKNKMG